MPSTGPRFVLLALLLALTVGATSHATAQPGGNEVYGRIANVTVEPTMTSAKISWDVEDPCSSEVASLLSYWPVEDAADATIVQSNGPGHQSVDLRDLRAETTYGFRIRLVTNCGGEGAASAQEYFITGRDWTWVPLTAAILLGVGVLVGAVLWLRRRKPRNPTPAALPHDPGFQHR